MGGELRSCNTSVLAMLGDLVPLYRTVRSIVVVGAGSEEDVTLVPGYQVPGPTGYNQVTLCQVVVNEKSSGFFLVAKTVFYRNFCVP